MLSPKLSWLREHGLVLRRRPSGLHECVLDEDNYGIGRDEDEATIDFCLKTGLPHWKTPI